MVTIKRANQQKPSVASWKLSEITQQHRKPSENTWNIRNYLKSTQNFPELFITGPATLKSPTTPPLNKPRFLTLLFCYWVSTWLIVRKVKLGKDDENPSNDHEITNYGSILTIMGDYFKISLQHIICWNKIAQSIKVLIFRFMKYYKIPFTANTILGTLFRNR